MFKSNILKGTNEELMMEKYFLSYERKSIFLIILIIFSFNLFASDYCIEFFTDDSRYDTELNLDINDGKISKIKPPKDCWLAKMDDGPIFPEPDANNYKDSWEIFAEFVTIENKKYPQVDISQIRLNLNIEDINSYAKLSFTQKAKINGNPGRISYSDHKISVDNIDLSDYKLHINLNEHPEWSVLFINSKLKDRAGNEDKIKNASTFEMKNTGNRNKVYTIYNDFFQKELRQTDSYLNLPEITIDLSYPEIEQEISIDIIARSVDGEKEIVLAKDKSRSDQLVIPDLNYYNLRARVFNKKTKVTQQKDVRSSYIWKYPEHEGSLTYSYKGDYKIAPIKDGKVYLPYDSTDDDMKKKKGVIRDGSLILKESTNIIIIDLNSTGEGTNDKNKIGFIDFLSEMVERSNFGNFLLYQYFNIYPTYESIFKRYHINNVNIFTDSEFYKKIDEKFKDINPDNYTEFKDYTSRNEIRIDVDKKIETFYVLEPFMKEPDLIHRTECVERINKRFYERVPKELYSERLKKLDFDFDNLIFITYYPKEDVKDTTIEGKINLTYMNYLEQKDEIIELIEKL